MVYTGTELEKTFVFIFSLFWDYVYCLDSKRQEHTRDGLIYVLVMRDALKPCQKEQ